MHNEGSHNGSGWSINTITTDLAQLLEASTSQGLFSILTPQRSMNSLASSNLSSSLPSQLSLPPISYNELLKDLTAKFAQQQAAGSSASSVVASSSITPFTPIIYPTDSFIQMQNLASLPGLSLSSTPFDTQSVHSSISRAKKRSITEPRRTSLPPHSIADEIVSQLRMDIPSTSFNQIITPDIPSKEDEEIQRELSRALRRAAKEEFRRRPAPIVPDTFPRAPTPENFGMLSETDYIPSHFFKGTMILLPDGTKKAVENLISDDFIMCATCSADVLMYTSSVGLIEKNALLYKVNVEVGHDREPSFTEVSPEQPLFVIGQGWSSCNPEKTNQIYGLNARELQRGDVCITLANCQYLLSQGTRRALESVVGPREAAIDASNEAKALRIYQKTVGKLPKKSKKKRQKDRHRRRERRYSEPPPSIKKRKRAKRCKSVDPHWETCLPPKESKPFSPKNNKDYPSHMSFDFEI